MQQKTTGAVRNIAVGMVTGVALGMFGQQMISQNKRRLRKKADKVVNRMESAIENTRDMIFKG